MKIAIIGAGVSGLTTAWFLRKKFTAAQASITMYEKSGRVGGNADTYKIILKDGTHRWVDMGVNDFNKDTYKNMVRLWEDLKIMDDRYCKPLINEESFWKGGTSNYKYWVNNYGKVNAEGSAAKDDAKTIEDGLEDFKTELVKWYKSEFKDPTITVGKWVEGRFQRAFIDNNLYPRINGMYYAQEYSQVNVPPPSLMPLWMVAHYYILQEGYGMANSDPDARQYFVGGSTKWLEHLRDLLRGINVDVDTGMNKSNLSVQRDIRSGKLAVVNGDVLQEIADVVIFATHAEDTIKLIQFTPSPSDPYEKNMMETLSKFKYGQAGYPAVAYAHEDASFLPGGKWSRTYNIHIYDYSKGTNRWPYTITYWENMHQKDPVPDTPFYTTLNPYNGGEPTNVAEREDGKGRAIANFRHCKLDVDAMYAQRKINILQIGSITDKYRPFYFAGSFTIGAGLHEECIIQAEKIANKIANPAGFTSVDHIYNFEKPDADFAPKYIMDAITRE